MSEQRRLPVTLAVDAGTSSSRCVVFDSALRAVASSSRPVSCSFPAHGWVEQDPLEILSSVLATVREAMTMADVDWPEVSALGIASQTETFVVWERATGKPVYPAIVWQDVRSEAYCATLREGHYEAEVTARTGLPLSASFTAPKLRWLLNTIPVVRSRAEAGELLFGDVNCWLVWNLTGRKSHVTEPSMAARTMLLNLGSHNWDPEMLNLFEVPAVMLPTITTTADGTVFTEPAACGGRVRIGATAGDQQSSLFGQRCWVSGMAKLTLGTGGFLWCNSGPRPPEGVTKGVVATCAWQLGLETTYALEGFVPTAGSLVPWLRRLGLLDEQVWPEINIDRLYSRSVNIMCVPALFGLGTPHWAATAGADFIGLTVDSTREELCAAALLGVVHQVVDALEAVASSMREPLTLVRVDGGMSRNGSIVQCIADLAEVTVERTVETEATALGIACLAGLGAGEWDLASLRRIPLPRGARWVPTMTETARAETRLKWEKAMAAFIEREGRQPRESGVA